MHETVNIIMDEKIGFEKERNFIKTETKQLNNVLRDEKQKFDTDTLDEAIKELLDICNRYDTYSGGVHKSRDLKSGIWPEDEILASSSESDHDRGGFPSSLDFIDIDGSSSTLNNLVSESDSTASDTIDCSLVSSTCTAATSKGSTDFLQRKSSSIEPNPYSSSSSNRNANINEDEDDEVFIEDQSEVSRSSAISNQVRNTYSTLSDLERIEEDEEDCYSNSDHFRVVFEEKISPTMSHQYNLKRETSDTATSCEEDSVKPPKYTYDRASIPQQTTSTLRHGQRINMLDRIQALGHDLRLISLDMRVLPGCVRGYLWKCCSNNSSWLKRYFLYDVDNKTLSYCRDDTQILRTKTVGRVSDIYVDHKLSGIGLDKKDKSSHFNSKRKKYVFAVVTDRRKYLLASSKVEIMRAWIDTLSMTPEASEYLRDEEDITRDIITSCSNIKII